MVKAAKSSAFRKDLRTSKSEDELPEAGATEDNMDTAVITSHPFMQPDQPPTGLVETYNGDKDVDFDNKEDWDFDDDDDVESESAFENEVCKGGHVEYDQPVVDAIVPDHIRTDTIDSFPDLRSLSLMWKLGLAAA